MKPASQEAATRAATAVNKRLATMGVDVAEVYRAANVDSKTLRKLREGSLDGYRSSTLGRISAALDWPSDTLARMLSGEDPETALQDVRSGTGYIHAGGTIAPSGTVSLQVVRGQTRRERIALLSGRLNDLDDDQLAAVMGYIESVLDQQQ